MSPRRPRGPYSVGIHRRDDILEVAADEFRANGYRGASLAQIAEKVGLTQAGVLHHFRSKPELLVGVLQRRDDMDAESFKLLDVEGSTGGALAVLDRLVSLVEANAKRRGMVQMFTVIVGEAVTDDHPAREWARERYAYIRELLVRALRNGIRDHQVRADADVESVAREVFAVMDGLQIQWLLDDSFDMAAAFRRYVEHLRDELAPRRRRRSVAKDPRG